MLKEEEIMQVEEVDCGEREEEVDDGDVGRSKMQLEVVDCGFRRDLRSNRYKTFKILMAHCVVR